MSESSFFTLRFTQPWLDAVSPLSLRFGAFEPDPDPDPAPELPIGEPTLGLFLHTPHVGAASLAKPTKVQQVRLSSSSEPRRQVCGWAWQSHVSCVHHLMLRFHCESPLFSLPQLLSNKNGPVMRLNDLSVAWSLPSVFLGLDQVLGRSDGAAQCMSRDLLWQMSPTALMHSGLMHWQTLPYAGQEVGLAYGYPDINPNDMTLMWGPHAPQWVCSTRYIPPTGIVSLSFSSRFSARLSSCFSEPSVVMLRFTPSPKVCVYDDGGGLIEAYPSLPNLDFSLPIEPQLRRIYLMQPMIECVRVSDGQTIVLASVTISHSRGQFAYSANLVFSSRIDAERAENALLQLTINGYDFFIISEQRQQSRGFGRYSYSASGRSRVAELAQPYQLLMSYTNDTNLSLAGMISALLGSSDWSVSLMGITDFVVPAGAVSLTQVTPISAINALAEQLGCMLLPDDGNKVLRFLPRWPTSPWETSMVTPDLTLHEGVLTSHSRSETLSPECNACWVRGEQQGVSAKVKRTGTSGDVATDDINAQLIVDMQAARLAGTNAIANTGNQIVHSVTVPILADLPPARVGMLVGIRDGSELLKGVCDSWSLSASVSSSGSISVSQSLSVIESGFA